jgi:hypothetical protein
MTVYPFHVDPRNAQDERDELTIQIAFRRKVRLEAPSVKLVAIPNAGRRSSYEQIKRAKEGLTAGFPDMQALHGGRIAFLEFKSGTGSLSTAQVDQMNWLHRNGFWVGVFRSADTACDWLRQLMPDAFDTRLAA